MSIRGKVNYFTTRDIKRIDRKFNKSNYTAEAIYDVLEEWMLENGYVLFDDDFEFVREIQVGRTWEIRYTCMVLRGIKRGGKFYLGSVGMGYHHIK